MKNISLCIIIAFGLHAHINYAAAEDAKLTFQDCFTIGTMKFPGKIYHKIILKDSWNDWRNTPLFYVGFISSPDHALTEKAAKAFLATDLTLASGLHHTYEISYFIDEVREVLRKKDFSLDQILKIDFKLVLFKGKYGVCRSAFSSGGTWSSCESVSYSKKLKYVRGIPDVMLPSNVAALINRFEPKETFEKQLPALRTYVGRKSGKELYNAPILCFDIEKFKLFVKQLFQEHRRT